MLLGVHCDVRGGYLAALRRAESLGCEAMQMLPCRRHHEPAQEEFSAFRRAFSESRVKRLVLHVRYAPFLASEDRGRRESSIRNLSGEMRFGRSLGAGWLVMHLGAFSPGATLERGLELFAEGVREASPGGPTLLVENVPGGGRRMGGSLEELADALRRLEHRGVDARACIDTAHAWAYGYELDSRDSMSLFLARVHHVLGTDIPVFHVNDSGAERGSHREDHARWGDGRVGSEALQTLLEREGHAVGILEAPRGTDEENLAFVRRAV
ncbi:MAG: TIM barrel protein [Elusimicrobiota bacterium]